MPEESSTMGYILNALDRQTKTVTTQGATIKILVGGLIALGGWCIHMNRKVNRLEKRAEKEKRRTEE